MHWILIFLISFSKILTAKNISTSQTALPSKISMCEFGNKLITSDLQYETLQPLIDEAKEILEKEGFELSPLSFDGGGFNSKPVLEILKAPEGTALGNEISSIRKKYTIPPLIIFDPYLIQKIDTLGLSYKLYNKQFSGILILSWEVLGLLDTEYLHPTLLHEMNHLNFGYLAFVEKQPKLESFVIVMKNGTIPHMPSSYQQKFSYEEIGNFLGDAENYIKIIDSNWARLVSNDKTLPPLPPTFDQNEFRTLEKNNDPDFLLTLERIKSAQMRIIISMSTANWMLISFNGILKYIDTNNPKTRVINEGIQTIFGVIEDKKRFSGEWEFFEGTFDGTPKQQAIMAVKELTKKVQQDLKRFKDLETRQVASEWRSLLQKL